MIKQNMHELRPHCCELLHPGAARFFFFMSAVFPLRCLAAFPQLLLHPSQYLSGCVTETEIEQM